MLRCRYVEDKERQALSRLLAELYRQQTVVGERKEPLSTERLAVPVREAVRPPEERPLAPRLLGKVEEVELLRMKQEETRRRREDEEREKRMVLHQPNMTWRSRSESRGRGDHRVNGNVQKTQGMVRLPTCSNSVV